MALQTGVNRYGAQSTELVLIATFTELNSSILVAQATKNGRATGITHGNERKG
jgi:hypothetical protein